MKRKKTALVVDDNLGILESLEALLEDRFEVFCAGDAVAAQRFLSQGDPNLLVLDIRMPGINGLQLLREIRQMGSQARVLILTASIWDEVREEAEALGVDGFFSKPFNIGELSDFADSLGKY